jgi:hypothetical protein
MISKDRQKKLDRRMYVYADCPAALFPKLTAFLQCFAEKEHTIIAVVGNLKPFDMKIQRSIRSSINEVCKTSDATTADWLDAIKKWHEKTGNSHNMSVINFQKRVEGCEVG